MSDNDQALRALHREVTCALRVLDDLFDAGHVGRLAAYDEHVAVRLIRRSRRVLAELNDHLHHRIGE